MIPLEHYLLLSAFLFVVGGVSFLVRRNLLFALMGIELMLNAVNLTLIACNRAYPEAHTGQMLAVFVIAVAAAEASVGLALVLAFYRLNKTVLFDQADRLRH